MKQVDTQLLANAFLKVRVGCRTRKIFFKDVRLCRKIMKKNTPAVPQYHSWHHHHNIEKQQKEDREHVCSETEGEEKANE